MPVSKAQQKAQNKWIAKAYDRINLTVPKGKKDTIQAHAEAQGQSVNAYINAAIDARMAQEVTGDPVKTPNPHEEAGVVSLSDTLKAAQEAAETAGETVPQFIDRAVATQSKQDEAERKLKGGNPNE